jgi:hypothetical protein
MSDIWPEFCEKSAQHEAKFPVYANFVRRFLSNKSLADYEHSLTPYLNWYGFPASEMAFEFLGDLLHIPRPGYTIGDGAPGNVTTAFAVWFRGVTKDLPVVNLCEPLVNYVGRPASSNLVMMPAHCDVRTLLRIICGNFWVIDLYRDPESNLTKFVRHVDKVVKIDGALNAGKVDNAEQALRELQEHVAAARSAALGLFRVLWNIAKEKFATDDDIRRGLEPYAVAAEHATKFASGEPVVLIHGAHSITEHEN